MWELVIAGTCYPRLRTNGYNATINKVTRADTVSGGSGGNDDCNPKRITARQQKLVRQWDGGGGGRGGNDDNYNPKRIMAQQQNLMRRRDGDDSVSGGVNDCDPE